MRIRRLLLGSFGCLAGEFHFSADRANLVVEPNERGKSTLAAAILAGLYGFPPGQRRSESRPITEVELYRPWRGEGYLVEMDIEAGGEIFTVRRDFAARKEQVFEWRSGKEITGRFQKSRDNLDFAGTLTGLDREDFARTAFLRQSEIRDIGDARGITAALQRMATSQQGDVAAAEAMGILDEALRQYRGMKIRRGKVDSEISGIEEEIEALRGRLGVMEKRRRDVEEQLRELESTTRKAGELEAELHRLEYLIIAAGRAEDMGRLAEESHDRDELEAREKEFQELSRFEKFPVASKGRLAELKARVEALDEAGQRLRQRRGEEVDGPLREKTAEADARREMDSVDDAVLARFESAETDLAIAWRAEREGRRGLRALERRLRMGGEDPARLRELAGRFTALPPQDRRFLMDFRASEAEAERALSDAERETAAVDERIGALQTRVRRTESVRLWLTIATGAAGLAAAGLAFVGPDGAVIAAGALAALLMTARIVLAGRTRDEESVEELWASRELFEKSRALHAGAIASLHEQLASIAVRVGVDPDESLLDRYRDAETRSEESGELVALHRSIAESRAAYVRSASTLAGMMKEAGVAPRWDAVTPRVARRFREAVAAHREIRREISEIAGRGASTDREIASIDEERSVLRAEIAAIVQEARLDPALDPARLVEIFEEAARARDRYETLRKEIIPDLVRRSMGRGDADLARRIEATGTILRRRQEEDPTLAGLEPVKSHKDYIADRDRLLKESRGVAERRLALAHELGEVLREYRRDYPDTQRWLREWEMQRDRARRYRTAVEMARGVLEQLSREAYAEWADVLNEKATDALAHLAPGYEDLRFDESLSFTLRDSRGRERRSQDDVDLRFSAGTRDQIYLSARLAMSGYLSSGGIRLPLILDDPFATFDDERFVRAMNVMLEKFSKRHQMIILSCHEARHRAWQDRHPEVFADRVRIMSLQPITP